MSKFYVILEYGVAEPRSFEGWFASTQATKFNTLPEARAWLAEEGDPEQRYAIAECTEVRVKRASTIEEVSQHG